MPVKARPVNCFHENGRPFTSKARPSWPAGCPWVALHVRYKKADFYHFRCQIKQGLVFTLPNFGPKKSFKLNFMNQQTIISYSRALSGRPWPVKRGRGARDEPMTHPGCPLPARFPNSNGQARPVPAGTGRAGHADGHLSRASILVHSPH